MLHIGACGGFGFGNPLCDDASHLRVTALIATWDATVSAVLRQRLIANRLKVRYGGRVAETSMRVVYEGSKGRCQQGRRRR